MKLFETAEKYCETSTWKTFAMVKICLFSLGIVIGLWIPKKKRKMVMAVGLLGFLITYVPLVGKFVRLWKE